MEVRAVGQLQLDQLGTKSHQGEVEVLHRGYPGIFCGGDHADITSQLRQFCKKKIYYQTTMAKLSISINDRMKQAPVDG